MSLILADVEEELRSRLRPMGLFTTSDSATRLRYAIRRAAFKMWCRQDWDFKNSTGTITTSVGNLGPYNPPAGLVRFASAQQRTLLGFSPRDRSAPIQSTATQDWVIYLNVQDGKLYFMADPGDSTLTLNFVAEFPKSASEGILGTTLLLFPSDLHDTLIKLTMADIKGDLPGMGAEADNEEARGLDEVDEVYMDSTLDQWPKTIAPRGLNKVAVDFVARPITLYGPQPGLISNGL